MDQTVNRACYGATGILLHHLRDHQLGPGIRRVLTIMASAISGAGGTDLHVDMVLVLWAQQLIRAGRIDVIGMDD